MSHPEAFSTTSENLQAPKEPRSESYKKVGKLALRTAACFLASSAAVAPLAAQHGIENAEVHDAIGQVPATFSFTGNGESSLKLGLPGSFNLPRSKHGIGIEAQIDGPPETGQNGLEAYFEPEFLEAHTAIFDNPSDAIEGYTSLLANDTIDEAIEYGLPRSLALTGAALLASQSLRRSRLQKNSGHPRSTQLVAASAAATLAVGVSTLYASHEFKSWGAEEQGANAKYTLENLNGTQFEGLSTDNILLYTLAKNAIPVIGKNHDRLMKQKREFSETALSSLQEQQDLIVQPEENEVAIMGQADMHGSEVMTDFQAEVVKLYNQKYGEGTISMLLIAGDLTFGTAPEKRFIDNIAKISQGAPTVVVEGNHESDLSRQQILDSGMMITDREVVKVDDTTILGIRDPQRSPFMGENYYEEGESQQATGEEAYDMALSQSPDVLMLHQPAAIEAFIGIKGITKFLNVESSHTEPYEDEVRDLPAAVVIGGHWHDELPFRVVWNSDGTWTLVSVLNTTGGAIEYSTINNYSLPIAAPRKTASFPVMFKNKDSGLITGYQMFSVEPDGSVIIEPRQHVGSPDGQPYSPDIDQDKTSHIYAENNS